MIFVIYSLTPQRSVRFALSLFLQATRASGLLFLCFFFLVENRILLYFLRASIDLSVYIAYFAYHLVVVGHRTRAVKWADPIRFSPNIIKVFWVLNRTGLVKNK